MNIHPGVLYFYPLKPVKQSIFNAGNRSVRTGIYADHLMSVGKKLGIGDYFLEEIVLLRKREKTLRAIVKHPKETAEQVSFENMVPELKKIIDNETYRELYYEIRNRLFRMTHRLEREILHNRLKTATVQENRNVFKLVYPSFPDEIVNKYYPQQ